MLLGNFLKVLNCATRTFNPLASNVSIRQLSGVCVNELKNVNLHKDLNYLGKEVEFYRLTPVSREAINEYKPTNMAFISESYHRYSASSLYKKAFKEAEANLPILKTLKTKWHNRPRTEVEGVLGKVMADFMPYIDFTMIILFPKWIQASYFMFMRPAAVYSGLGSASTIKMISDKMVLVGPESEGRLYILVKISEEEAVDLPIHEIAIKIKK